MSNEDLESDISRLLSNRSLILSLLNKLLLKSLIEGIWFCLGSSSEMLKILFFVWLLVSVGKIDLYVFCIFFFMKRNNSEECIFVKSRILFLIKGDKG